MRKFKQVFLASVLASSMVVTPVFADDVSNLQNSKNAAQSEVNSLQSELQTLIEKMSKLEDGTVQLSHEVIDLAEYAMYYIIKKKNISSTKI